MIEKLKVGDKVLIRDRSTVKHNESPTYTTDMEHYGNKITIITEYLSSGNFLLKIDQGKFSWSPKWLVKVEKGEEKSIKEEIEKDEMLKRMGVEI